MGLDTMILVFCILSFKLTFSLSCLTNRLFSSSSLYFLFDLILTGNSIYWWAWSRRGQCWCSWVQGPPFVQGSMIRDVFDPTAIWDVSLFCHHVFKFICVELGKSPLLGDVDLLVARELEPGPAEGFNHMLLVLQLGWPMWILATVSWGFPKAPRIPAWSLSAPAQDNLLLTRMTWKGWSCTRVKTISATAFHHVLVCTNTGSRQGFRGELLCSSDTMWPKNGNSSTLAFLSPKSNMQILASGTPRQKRDFGFSLFLQYRSHRAGRRPVATPGSSVPCRRERALLHFLP